MTNADAPPTNWEDVRQWRKRTRATLLERRLATPLSLRIEQGAAALEHLRQAIDMSAHHVIGIYWPMRGEIDVRDIARTHVQRGGDVGLPVVVARDAAVEFWQWQPGMPMNKGIWDIPVPATRERVHPTLLIVPLVGFDAQCYRLGYGGGYYDRTIAAASPRPMLVGLGLSSGALPSIYPQVHDIAMQMIFTEEGIRTPTA